MDLSDVLSNVQDLSDLEIAMLLSLMASQHAMLKADETELQNLVAELELAAKYTFGLSCTSLVCSPSTSLDDFRNGLLIEEDSPSDSLDYSASDGVGIPNVIVIRDLHKSSHQIQMQTLELLRHKRLFTHTAVHGAPKQFLILIIADTNAQPLVSHLRDHVCLSHTHAPEEGFPNLQDAEQNELEGSQPVFSREELEGLASAAAATTVTIEVTRYMHDIVIFLRMHRAVARGMTPLATKHFISVCKCLAPLHGLSFVTPSLVLLAARKVFNHRLAFVTPSTERSMQYGSEVTAIAAMLKELTPELVIEEVLASVECPV